MTIDRPRRVPDRLGWLELIGRGLGFGAVLGLSVAQLVGAIRDERVPSPTSWTIAAAICAAICAVAMPLIALEWRKHGGRRVQRLGRRAWLTRRLPEDLPGRVAVLRDLERRERKLERQRLPAWGVAALWTLLIAWHLASEPSPSAAAAWLALWSAFLATGVVDVVDRRRRPLLRRLIAELRHDPVSVRLPSRR